MENEEAFFKASIDRFPYGADCSGFIEFAECLIESFSVDREAGVSVQEDSCGLETVTGNGSETSKLTAMG